LLGIAVQIKISQKPKNQINDGNKVLAIGLVHFYDAYGFNWQKI